MAYETSNPPQKLVQSVGGRPGSIWMYVDGDAIAAVDAAGYFSNAGDLGMQTGDLVISINTTGGLTTISQVTVTSGAGTITALTAVP